MVTKSYKVRSVTSSPNIEGISEEKYNSIIDGTTTIGDLSDANVDTIKDSLFYLNKNLTEVIFPNNLISIGNKAFCGTRLTSVVIPNTVISIGEDAFSYNNDLLSVDLGSSVKTIGNNAFRDCQKLKTLNMSNVKLETVPEYFAAFTDIESPMVIPDTVKTIGPRAFMGCKFRSLTLSNSLEVIGDYAFHRSGTPSTGYKYLNGLVLPKSLISIGKFAFEDALSMVYYEGTMEEFSNILLGESWAYLENQNKIQVVCSDGTLEVDR